MGIDGRAIATAVYERLRVRVERFPRAPHLTILTCNPHFETQKYLVLKQKRAKEIGIAVTVTELGEDATTEDFLNAIRDTISVTDCIIVQLPLPQHIDTERVLRAVPPSHDVDALGESPNVLSPVVGAIREILTVHDITVTGKHVTIIGNGKLVGLPVYAWFSKAGAQVSVVTKDTEDIGYYTRPADIIVCGAGVPGLLKPDMVKDGVIILDAGTSEDGGVLRGDADPACAEKATLFTPVPGGIGPITIAILLQNVVDCATKRQSVV